MHVKYQTFKLIFPRTHTSASLKCNNVTLTGEKKNASCVNRFSSNVRESGKGEKREERKKKEQKKKKEKNRPKMNVETLVGQITA